ncbi:polymorphic toxin type 30 domain-containing protein [Paenibacillus sp. 2TAF8]|uniref:polymorphic toxin type 30 domain-containing protein n=1 Tax=Paenibacillus sp. 2TAF8 TaxID=3233020 RepID=UPI003F98AA62
MTRIQVHPDEMEKNVRLLQQSKQQLGKIVYELDKTMYFLQSEWSGVTSEKFFWDFMNIKESVFPSTLGLLDKFQNKISMTLSAFKKADNSDGEMLQIPDKLEPNFATGLIDKAIGDTVTGVGETVEALFYNPFSTLGSLAYDLTVGKIVDVGRGVGFAWDTAWGTGTARSDIEQFVNEQKKQLSEDESGYYKGAVVGQALSYFLFGKALHSKDHHGSGGSSGSGEGKKGPEKESGKEGKGEIPNIDLNRIGTGAVGDFQNVKDVNDLLSRIPEDAKQIPWREVPGGAKEGVKFRWVDEAGKTWDVRTHSVDPTAPLGSNAANGWIYRVEVKQVDPKWKWTMDSNGNFHKENVLREKSPYYDESIANETHIPFVQ